MHVAHQTDAVTVYFTLTFNDQADFAIAKVMAQELQECKVGGAPSVAFSKVPSGELASATLETTSKLVGFVQFSTWAYPYPCARMCVCVRSRVGACS